jgi:hypothetical protein
LLFHVELAHKDERHDVEALESGRFHRCRHFGALLERNTSRE